LVRILVAGTSYPLGWTVMLFLAVSIPGQSVVCLVLGQLETHPFMQEALPDILAACVAALFDVPSSLNANEGKEVLSVAVGGA
jgi:hypothetical protein